MSFEKFNHTLTKMQIHITVLKRASYLVCYYYFLEILNNFIFELVFSKSSLIGQRGNGVPLLFFVAPFTHGLYDAPPGQNSRGEIMTEGSGRLSVR